MLSRVADHIYWMNRYIERAENYARFMDVNFNLSLDLQPDEAAQWRPLVVTTGDWPLYQSLHKTVSKSKVIHFLGFDERNPNSVHNCIVYARENARSIRPEITKEVWEQINYLYYFVKEGTSKKKWENKDPRNYFLEIKKGCQMLYGILNSTISRSEGWHFGRIGQLIERADKTSRVLDVKYHILLPESVKVGSPFDLIQWSALLKSVSAYDMYRRKYGKLTAQGICEFLIFDKHFPRSILSCLTDVDRSLRSNSNKDSIYRSTAEKQLGLLRSQLEYSDINEVFETGVHEFLDNIQVRLNEVSESIFQNYFSVADHYKSENPLFSNNNKQVQ
ncbi:Uncharacterized conserved protein, Alpha-E superfamily [Marivirga sericea]|uniref:Uncharacterized conserved protein, Alpha-E superfamily n=1 Tax=Marivirga sericea TaxID=1028 RepID=A0A1X7IFC3_9BACT|nr:alpha-E domain-containing protein [Marivirga sericea]SMG13472.1 Uncharacterized conserved protein, Alpha-E superfamily [Marivirga sericea]